MVTPEGFPLIDGQAVSSERYSEMSYRGSSWLSYRISHTILAVPEHLFGDVMGHAADGHYVARVPAIGVELGDPCYWYTKAVETAPAHEEYVYEIGYVTILAKYDVVHIALPFYAFAARVPIKRSEELRALVRDGRIPHVQYGESWPEV